MEDGFLQLCSGHLPLHHLPSVSPRSLTFFICSSFTDFEQERQILRNEAYPQLFEYFRANYGLQFKAVDVKLDLEKVYYDAGDYWTVFHDLKKRYCFSSPDCIPVVLLGQKFGVPILPKRLPSKVYQLIRANLRAHSSPLSRQYSLLDDWYKRDENSSLEDSEYVLLSALDRFPNLTSDNEEDRKADHLIWQTISQTLSSLFKEGLGLCLQHGNIDDTTAYELLSFELDSCVSHMLANSDNPDFQPIVLEREIIDVHNYVTEEYYKIADKFVDIEINDEISKDETTQVLLGEMNDRIQAFTTVARAPFHVLWRHPGGIDKIHHAEYLQEFCQAFVEAAKAAAQSRLFAKQVPVDSEVLRVYDDAWTSLELYRKLSPFATGHETLVNCVVDYVLQDEGQFTFVLHGGRNCNKVPIIARSFLELQLRQRDMMHDSNWLPMILIPRLVQFPTKTSAFLKGIYNQVRTCVPLNASQVPRSFQELVSCLQGCSIVILVAGAELLLDDNDEPMTLSNLCPQQQLPLGIKLVLTTNQPNVLSLCGDNLRALHIDDSSPSSYRQRLDLYLKTYDRRLLCKDSLAIESNFQATVLFSRLQNAASFYDISNLLSAGTLSKLINLLLEEQEKKFGHVLVKYAVAYLTLSGGGISDFEMTDLLSLDDKVLDSIKVKEEDGIRRFPEPLWLLLKQGLGLLVSDISKDGFFLTYWSSISVVAAIEERYLQDAVYRQRMHFTMADYFLGSWHKVPKPVSNSEISAYRLVPSQKLSSGSGFYNERQFRQLPRHLCLSERLPEMNNLVLFSYDWLYFKSMCLGLDEALKDFELVQQNLEVSLVEETLRKSADILHDNLTNLSAELSGQLISYSYLYKNIKNLVRQADVSGCQHNVFVPSYPYAKLPGSALQATVQCPTDLVSMELRQESLYVKLKESPTMFGYDLTQSEMASEINLSDGELYLTTDLKYALVLDLERRHTIKVHLTKNGEFIGHLTPLNWIDTLPFEEKHMFRITNICVGKTLVATVTTSRVSYVTVADIATCQPVHIFKPDGRTALCHLSPDEKLLFTNNGDQVLVFEVGTGVQTAAVDLLAKPKKLTFTKDGQRAFILCENEQKIVILFMGEKNTVEMSYKIMFENSLGEDSLLDMKLSQDEHLLLVRAKANVLVYDFSRDAIIAHIKRPPEIPKEFKMPNSNYESIDFTEADFAFDDRVVVTAIFRDVLVWEVADAKPLVMLHAPTGILTRLLVDQERNSLIGYISHSKEIHLWSLQGAFTDGTVIDCLTSEIQGIRASDRSGRAIAFCDNSDELGVIDLNTGFLTDLYSHEGPVKDCALSVCGNYALVAVQQRSPGTTHILWSLSERKILTEFGDVPAQLVSCTKSCAFYLVGQSEVAFKTPFNVCKLTVGIDNGKEMAMMQDQGVQTTNLLSKPFLTQDDRYLVFLTAEDFNEKTTLYEDVQVTALNTQTQDVCRLTSAILCNFTLVTRLLGVHYCSQNPSTILILFSDAESTRRLLIFDLDRLQSLSIARLEEAAPGPLHFSPCGLFCVDNENQLLSLQADAALAHVAPKDVTVRGFLPNLLICSFDHYLLAFRIPEGTMVGKVSAHEIITEVTLCRNSLALVGCASGNVFSYTVIDGEDIQEKVQTIPSREVLNSEKARSWDRLIKNDRGEEMHYSRPPSVRIEAIAQRRANSDPAMEMNRARSCSIM